MEIVLAIRQFSHKRSVRNHSTPCVTVIERCAFGLVPRLTTCHTFFDNP